MPTTMSQIAVGTANYVPLGSINGKCTVTTCNGGGIVIRLAGELDSVPANAYATYVQIPSNTAAVYTFECNPSKTWAIAESGGMYLSVTTTW
jgi:hypothetical protein